MFLSAEPKHWCAQPGLDQAAPHLNWTHRLHLGSPIEREDGEYRLYSRCQMYAVDNWTEVLHVSIISVSVQWGLSFVVSRAMVESGRSTLTPAGTLLTVAMAGHMTPASLWTPWSRSWTWSAVTPGGLPPPLLSSMLAASLATLSLDKLQTGLYYVSIQVLHCIDCRYGRRFAFFVMLFMSVSLSVAIAFSPNYWVYTIIRLEYLQKLIIWWISIIQNC